MPLATLSATITADGISAPTYDEILQSLQESFQGIYGTDAYIAADSQDGQLLAVFAKGISDENDMAIAVYNNYSPSFAIGAGLSSQVKINGISRNVPTNSTAVGNVVGTVGLTVIAGVVQDDNGALWDLPAEVTIPLAGTVAVTVTARDPGAVSAQIGTINRIYNPQRGWSSFSNSADAVPGEAVETDAVLRRRQSLATARSAKTPNAGLLGALSEVVGVTEVRVYENDTGSADTNGAPAHSIYAVVEGGDLTDIAETIGQKKTPGAATYGTTTEPYTDPNTGVVYSINFFVAANESIKVNIEGTQLDGYSTVVEDAIRAAVAAYINALGIGDSVKYSRMYAPAYLSGAVEGGSYTIETLEIAKVADAFGVVDIAVAYNKIAYCDPTNIVISII